ncbi:MAG: hypothetical protein Q8Q48_01270 [Candidatus Staskawiczbacteria bacterium]|nr:hypothetical protein [Candidatus Staskawiczbacteria bacterium]
MLRKNMFPFKKTFWGLLAIVFMGLTPGFTFASSDLYLSPSSGTYVVGRDFAVSIMVDTNGDKINTVSASLSFDKSKFKVTSITTGIFGICVSPPSFNNDIETISFACGIQKTGYSGSSGLVATVHFKGIALGEGKVDFNLNPVPEIYLNNGDFDKQNQVGQTRGGIYTIISESLSVSCLASPSSTIAGQPVTFTATSSGGTGAKSYLWEEACQGQLSSSSCTTSFSNNGTKTASVTVQDDTETASAQCSTAIGIPGLNVSCSPSKELLDINEIVTFTAQASGGSGNYNYSWSGDCSQSTNYSNCTRSYESSGIKKTTVSVTSGDKASSSVCNVYVNSIFPVQTNESHSICHNQKCEYILGAGTDECGQDLDCEQPPIIDVVEIIDSTVKALKEMVNTPFGSTATKTVATLGLLATALVVSPPSLAELLMLPARLLGLLLMAFGWKKRNPPWGIVYDSITKQPLDPAYVMLKDMNGRDISSAITDLDGRYGFLADPGFYKMSANKTNYLFPSQKLSGKIKDELYDNLYFGDQVEIKRGEVITRNIPLDPLKFDWNEFSKKDRKLTKFYSTWDMALRKFSDAVYFIGFIIALIAVFAAPYPYNSIIFGLYVFLFILRMFGIKPKSYGSITNKNTKNPVPFAILRVMEPDTNRELSHRVTDRYGRYFCLVPKGRYYVKIDNKNNDGSYSSVYESGIIDASKTGIIKERFKIL